MGMTLDRLLAAWDAGLAITLITRDFNGEIIDRRPATSREEIIVWFNLLEKSPNQ